MSATYRTIVVICFVSLSAISTGCKSELWTTMQQHSRADDSDIDPNEAANSEQTAELVPQTSAESELDRHRDLCLFGRDDMSSNIAFEGKAATDVRQHTSPGEGADFDPDVDPTGKQLVFASTRHSRHSHLYTKSIDGAVVTQITDESADDAQPAFSPDGKLIAFTSDRGGQWDIWVVDTNGRNPIQITRNPMPELHPSWSPDGKRLVYCRLNSKENRGELWVADLENPGVKRFIGEGLFPDWSPTGDKIVYQRARERGSRWFSIWTIDLREDEVLFPTEIASNTHAALISPAWSADGTQVAFASVRAESSENAGPDSLSYTDVGRSDIVMIDTDGRGLQRLTDGRGKHYAPTWAVDGRVFFTAKLSKGESIWSIKPFRPVIFTEPPVKTGNHRAAYVDDPATEP
ncbi:MAG: hypothetical protein ABII12_01315 [Planctomycetota bacterium]